MTLQRLLRVGLFCGLLLGGGNLPGDGEQAMAALNEPRARTAATPLKSQEQAAFAADPEFFQPMPKPGPSDWLAGPGRGEREQTFEDYIRSSPPGRTADRRVIVFQPLGESAAQYSDLLEKVRQYCEIYFDTPTRLEKSLPLPTQGTRARQSGGRTWNQYLTSAILDDLLAPRLPKDAICYLGVTLEDLYPQRDWNFVFGQASLSRRVGVYSFARYRPEFYGTPSGPEAAELLLMRSVKVMVHETGHMFGLLHCRRWRCVQNGSNHLAESDARPVFLCPDCLHKLHSNLGLDLLQRYERMESFWKENGFEKEREWLRLRVDAIKRAAGPTP